MISWLKDLPPRFRVWRLARHVEACQRAGLLVTTPQILHTAIALLEAERMAARRAGGGNASKLADRGKTLRRIAIRMRDVLLAVLRQSPAHVDTQLEDILR